MKLIHFSFSFSESCNVLWALISLLRCIHTISRLFLKLDNNNQNLHCVSVQYLDSAIFPRRNCSSIIHQFKYTVGYIRKRLRFEILRTTGVISNCLVK